MRLFVLSVIVAIALIIPVSCSNDDSTLVAENMVLQETIIALSERNTFLETHITYLEEQYEKFNIVRDLDGQFGYIDRIFALLDELEEANREIRRLNN
jgi:hypothetical protein